MPDVTLIRDSDGRVTTAVVVGADPDRHQDALDEISEAIRLNDTMLAFDDGWNVTVV